MTYEQLINDNMDLIHKLAHKYKVPDRLYKHDDMVQEGLMKLYDVYTQYDDTYAPTTFITTILTNFYLNMIRDNQTDKRQNKDTNGNSISHIYDYDLDMINDSDRSKTQEELNILSKAYQTLEKYNDRDREIIELRLSGQKYKDIAHIYGVSKQRIYAIFDDFISKVNERL